MKHLLVLIGRFYYMIFGKLNKALSRVSGALYTGYNTGGLKAARGGGKNS